MKWQEILIKTSLYVTFEIHVRIPIIPPIKWRELGMGTVENKCPPKDHLLPSKPPHRMYRCRISISGLMEHSRCSGIRRTTMCVRQFSLPLKPLSPRLHLFSVHLMFSRAHKVDKYVYTCTHTHRLIYVYMFIYIYIEVGGLGGSCFPPFPPNSQRISFPAPQLHMSDSNF